MDQETRIVYRLPEGGWLSVCNGKIHQHAQGLPSALLAHTFLMITQPERHFAAFIWEGIIHCRTYAIVTGSHSMYVEIQLQENGFRTMSKPNP